MNLKEAFRYQNFLDRVFGAAAISIQVRDHCLTQTREHLCNKVNPDADDFREEVKTEEEFFPLERKRSSALQSIRLREALIWILMQRQLLINIDRSSMVPLQ